MKPLHVDARLGARALAAALLLAASCGAPPAAAPSSAVAEPSDDEAGFVSIFDGRDLDGWIYGGDPPGVAKVGRGYQVENGAIVCTADDGGNLFTKKEYADFVLRLELRLTPNANNGIGIRAPLAGDAAYAGMEIQVLDDSGSDYARLQPWQYHGSIYNVVPARRGALKPVGAWNAEEIAARGRRITVRLNGETIVDADLNTIRDAAVLKKHPGLARARGHIGLLGHGSRVEFRNVRLREL